ncbi:hypothetical protein COB55_00370 [Candidatus Wolfebacteria bacterium]|nr:MAG: hypothetical protein COB55_00370 [Candidatus Wolfebacteria bacterium]
MVKRILGLLSRDIKGLHEAAYLLGFFAFLSQILGIVRDRLFAHIFGASSIMDVYYAAFRVPDLIFVSIASIVSISVLIPFIAERLEDDKQALKKFIDNTFSAFSILIISVSAVVFLFVPKLSVWLFPTLIAEHGDSLILITRILLLSPIFFGFSNLLGSITQVKRRFTLFAVGPLLYNVGIIVGIVGFYPVWGIGGLGIGVALGALLQMLIHIPYVRGQGLLPRFKFDINLTDFGKVVFLSLPRTLTLSAHHLVLLVLVVLSGGLGVGLISIFSFSWNLQSVPLAIIGVSYSVAAFPTLARLFSKGEKTLFFEQITNAARHIIFWSIPAMVLFIVLRAQVVRVILGSGEFGWTDTRLTAAALALFVMSLTAQSLVLLFVRGYYAAGKTVRPLIVNVTGSLITVVLAFGLLKWFEGNLMVRYFFESLLKVEGLEGTVILMLPLAYTLGLTVNLVLFWILFQRDFKRFSSVLGRTFFQSLSASVVMGFVAHRFLIVFAMVFNTETLFGIFLQGFSAGVMGIGAGLLVLKMLGSTEIKESLQTVRQKFWKTKVIGAEQEEL